VLASAFLANYLYAGIWRRQAEHMSAYIYEKGQHILALKDGRPCYPGVYPYHHESGWGGAGIAELVAGGTETAPRYE
jgi:hypothetical protein